MRRDNNQQKIVLAVGIALSAGVFSIMPSASAAPVLDHVVRGGAAVDQTTTPNVTDVTSTTRNNVIDWKDFSVAQGETVRFDGGEKINNYLNVVSGANTSHIDGAIKGGNDVYIVNPNGVIFGNSASVDVGSLYVSSRPLSEVDYTNIDANADTMQPLVNAASSLSGDIVNMGTVQADYVYVEGNNVKFMDTAQVKTAAGNAVNDNVKIVAEGAIRLGHRPEEMTAAVSTKRAKLLTSNRSGYSLTSGLGTTNFTTITNQAALEGINTTDLAGDYELGNDITVTGEYTPVGNATNAPFTGKFDGNYFTVSGIKVSSSNATYGGLFGYTDGATIKNVGVSEVDITADYAGGIVGKAENTTLTNVFNAGGKVTPTIDFCAGGIAGYVNKTDIEVAYNHASVSADNGGGIVGTLKNDAKKDSGEAYVIKHAYDDNKNVIVGYMDGIASVSNTVVDDVYTTGTIIQTTFAPFKKPDTFFTSVSSKSVADYEKNINTSDEEYTSEKRGLKGLDISNSGSDDTMWRIYEGQTTPLLRPLLRKGVGPVTLKYKYTHGSNDSGSNNGADLTAANITYNAKYVVADTTSVDYGDTSGFSNFDSSKIKYSGNTAVRNISTQALFYSDQTGYDLIGNNVTMAQKKVSISGASSLNISKVYDGKTDVTDAFKEAFNESDSGIESEDADYVKVGFSTDFTAKFADKNVGEDKPISFVGGLTLTYDNEDSTAKTLANNYDVDTSALTGTSSVDVKGTITQRPIYLNFTEPQNGIKKTYDGTDEVKTTLTNVFELNEDDIQTDDNGTPDNVSLAAADSTSASVPVYVDKETHVGADDPDNGYKAVNAGDKAVKVTGVSLTGTDAANYVLYYGTSEVTDSTVYLDGTIEQKEITLANGNFHVVDKEGNDKTGSKVYDGSSAYSVSSDDVLHYDGSGIGIVDRDDGDNGVNSVITFALAGTGSYFVDDNFAATKNAGEAAHIAYSAQAVTSDAEKHPLSNYKYKDANDVYHTLGTETINVFGDGEITRRELTIGLKTANGIEKYYDQSPDLPDNGDYTTFGGDYVNYADNTAFKLVKDDTNVPPGAEDNANISITASYAATGTEGAAEVYRNANHDVVENGKTVNFYVTMTGSDAKNYTVNGTKAEELSATSPLLTGSGTIKPLDLIPTFAVIEKTYNGTAAINDGDAVIKGTQTTPANNNVGTVTGMLENDNVSLVYDISKAAFSDSNASDTAKTITYSGLSLEGDQAHNYKLAGGTEAEGTGYINRRLILKDSFTVNGDKAAKTYDGSSTYTLTDGAVLMADVAESGQTGVVTADQEYLHFSLDSAGNTHFVTVDGNGDITDDDAKTVAGANKVAYAIIATADSGKEYLLDNYKIGTTTSAQNLTNNGQYSVTGDGEITRRELTITAAQVTDINKPYDKKTTVADEYKVMGEVVKYANDSLTLVDDGTEWVINGNYNGADVYRDNTPEKKVVDNGKEVTFTAYLSGNAADNYTINSQNAEDYKESPYELAQKSTGTITPLTITPEFNKITKTYTGTQSITDGNANASGVTLGGNLDGENVTLNYGTDLEHAYFATPDVGDEITITYTGLKLEGAKRDNYEIASTATGTGKINPASVSMSDFVFNFAGVNKVYDADADVADTTQEVTAKQFMTEAYIDLGGGKYSLDNYYSITSATYNNANAGNGKGVTYKFTIEPELVNSISNFTITNFDANYFVDNPVTKNVGTITPRTVHATINNPKVTKIYDAYTDVKNYTEPLVSYDNLVGESTDATTAVYTDKNVGSDKLVKYNIAISDGDNYYIYYNGDDSNIVNYTSDGTSPITSTDIVSTVYTPNNVINQRDLKLTFKSATKVYDGSTKFNASTPSGTDLYSFDDLQGSDTLLIMPGRVGDNFYTDSANYNSSHVADATEVTYDNLRITGNENGNYRLLDAAGKALGAGTTEGTYKTTGTGTITPYKLTALPDFNLNHVNKEYDGGTQVSYNRDTSSDAQKKYITASVPYELVSATYENSTVNSTDGSTVATGKANNKATFVIKLNNGDYDFSEITNPGGEVVDGGYQYTFSYANATITPRTINVSLGTKLKYDTDNHYVTKVYDGNQEVKQTILRSYFNFGDGDVLTTDADKVYLKYNNSESTGISASYTDDANAGNAKNVTYTLELDGNAAENYVLSNDSLNGQGDIQQRELTITLVDGTVAAKSYDGNTNMADGTTTIANNNNNHFAIAAATDTTGVVDGDNITVTGAKAVFVDSNVNRNSQGTVQSQVVNFSDFMLTGNDNNNYKVATATSSLNGSGMINPLEVNVSVTAEAPEKVYDKTISIEDEDITAAQNSLTYTANNVVDGDSVGVELTGGSYDDYNAAVGNKGYSYTLSLDNPNYEIGTVNSGQTLNRVSYDADTGKVTYMLHNNDGTIKPRTVTATVNDVMTKVYDGTTDGTANASAKVSPNNVITGDNLNLMVGAVYDNPDAGVSEDSDINKEHTVTYTLSINNNNYVLDADSKELQGTGYITRAPLTVSVKPVSVNAGEAMPNFSGSVSGFVNNADAAGYGFTYKSSAASTSTPGQYSVYGWYNNRYNGNLGLNYTFSQAPANATAFTVNYVDSGHNNPDTKVTPTNNIYQQISKDKGSGFGDNAAAALEYVDKNGQVIGRENIDSGEIHDGSVSLGSADDMTSQDTSLANIGIVGGDIVNVDGADAAGLANIEVTDKGTTVNLEVTSSSEAGDKQAVAEITDMPAASDNSSAQIQNLDGRQEIVEQLENKDKDEEKKESEIAIESKSSQNDDEIELKIEGSGVKVA